MSEEAKKPQSQNRPRRRRKSSKKPQGQGPGPGPQQGQPGPKAAGSNSGRRKSNNRKRRPNTKRNPQGPKLSPLDRLIVKYENLREQHIEARRKYFDLFDRADPQQKDKLERVFTNTMVKIKEFEESLKPEDKELFDKHYNAYSPDLIYSENHELSPEGEPVVQESEESEDPHYLESQKMTNYSDDSEESMGTLEDYERYKGV